ncbi:hypothetical protein BC828DRAFT_394116 [Blastocladiella britannica]|nr:hypothetical protein BC828DRAFT_394116 [Blastocladiella britannica]
MAEIANAALVSLYPAVVAWWWERFLEHRTPEHKFGNQVPEVGQFTNAENLDWYHRRYQESSELFVSSNGNPLGIKFILAWIPNLPILQWTVDKCAELGEQKRVLTQRFFTTCARSGQVDLLDLVLRSTNALEMEWPVDLVSNALRNGYSQVLEWWDRNQDKLPPQNLDCTEQPSTAALRDAVDAIAWWHAHGFPASKADAIHARVYWHRRARAGPGHAIAAARADFYLQDNIVLV